MFHVFNIPFVRVYPGGAGGGGGIGIGGGGSPDFSGDLGGGFVGDVGAGSLNAGLGTDISFGGGGIGGGRLYPMGDNLNGGTNLRLSCSLHSPVR